MIDCSSFINVWTHALNPDCPSPSNSLSLRVERENRAYRKALLPFSPRGRRGRGLRGWGLPHHLIQCDRQVADAPAGGVVDSIRDGGGHARDPDLADALNSQRVDVGVVFIDKHNIDIGS